ncbi:altronate dehydratase small subunit [Neobacillus niacini]|uniref:UxaA family hydrolase n=1 Tax=Neobacillus niacini TaxID=86668 RepID=UPI00286292EC|nr:UxaA family hydrolase [Neobacillus niacini]MDR7080026.1 altronate dehydratase small subunit [Neobacillus niacini]
MSNEFKTVMMKPQDKVAVALDHIPEGSIVQVTCQGKRFTVKLKEDIEFGHKFAVVSISFGEDILKYGEVIGAAIQDIQPGQHVHVHNLEGKRGRGDKIAYD